MTESPASNCSQVEREFQALASPHGHSGLLSAQSQGETASNENEIPSRRVSVQAEGVSHELGSLSQARRVSNLGATFRRALESIVGTRQPEEHAVRRLGTPRLQSDEEEFDMIEATDRYANGEGIAYVGTREGPEARADEAVTSAAQELSELRRHSAVVRRLQDESFRDRLERVLRVRLHNPPGEEVARRRLREGIRQGRAQRLSDPAPALTTATTAGSASIPMGPSLQNVQLVTGASFELLLSIQRMLQQELTAALHAPQMLQEPPQPTNEMPVPHVIAAHRGRSLGACVVCCEAEVNTVFYKCGHLCTCARCAHNLRSRRASCPICRAPIREVIQAFLACAPSDLAD